MALSCGDSKVIFHPLNGFPSCWDVGKTGCSDWQCLPWFSFVIEHPRSQKCTSNFLRVDGLRAWPPANIIGLVRKSAKAFLTLPSEAKQNENWINMQTLNTIQTNEKSNIHIVCAVCIHWFTSRFCCLWDKKKKDLFQKSCLKRFAAAMSQVFHSWGGDMPNVSFVQPENLWVT